MSAPLEQLENTHANLQRAIAVLDRVPNRVLTGSDLDQIETNRSGVIQNFKVVYEQSWKVLRRQLYRLAAKHGLLDDVKSWWEFHEARNKTSHTYSPPSALEVAEKARLFDTACGQLIRQLKAQSIKE